MYFLLSCSEGNTYIPENNITEMVVENGGIYTGLCFVMNIVEGKNVSVCKIEVLHRFRVYLLEGCQIPRKLLHWCLLVPVSLLSNSLFTISFRFTLLPSTNFNSYVFPTSTVRQGSLVPISCLLVIFV